MSSKPTVLVVDDNADVVDTVAKYLSDDGFVVEPATTGRHALKRLEEVSCDVVITDLRMPDIDGIDLLEAIQKIEPRLPVLIMTAFGNVENAVDAMKRGAYDFVTKPFRMATVRNLLERAGSERRLSERYRQLLSMGLVGRSPAMSDLRTLIQRVADSPSSVLILGETGTGKELVARAIHLDSQRRDSSFVSVNCAALPEPLLDSTLFGHAKGAFPGAGSPRRGLFVEADGGTLFLDEVGDLPLGLQAKFLHVLQRGEIRPLGAELARQVDVRCIAASQRDLHALVREGRFREDLYFRLNVLPMRIAPLRERRQDVPLLVEHFLGLRAERTRGPAHALTREALSLLESYRWPGNVRELENLIERLVVTAPDREIGADAVRAVLAPVAPLDPIDILVSERVSLEELDDRYTEAVLRRSGGNKAKAAAILGVDATTLYRRDKRRS